MRFQVMRTDRHGEWMAIGAYRWAWLARLRMWQSRRYSDRLHRIDRTRVAEVSDDR
jgi:hypothetical protein